MQNLWQRYPQMCFNTYNIKAEGRHWPAAQPKLVATWGYKTYQEMFWKGKKNIIHPYRKWVIWTWVAVFHLGKSSQPFPDERRLMSKIGFSTCNWHDDLHRGPYNWKGCGNKLCRVFSQNLRHLNFPYSTSGNFPVTDLRWVCILLHDNLGKCEWNVNITLNPLQHAAYVCLFINLCDSPAESTLW